MHIGLIALSGIRVQDQELLELGMTLPGFVERSKVIASLPSLGLLTLAGMTPTHHHVTYLEIDQITDDKPLPDFDLVAISTFTAQAFDAYHIADRYRDRNTPVVIGGLHATAMPDEAANHADAVIVGEGETVWNQLIEDAESNTLKPRYDARTTEFDLADAVMPAFELLDLDRYNRITVQTTRGCPFRCEFCASSIMLTRQYKHKPINKVLAEVDRIRERWPRPFLEFADDNSFVNKRYWQQLLPELAKRRVRWFTETDISVADDPELLTLMHDAGCAEVLIGLESPVSQGLDGLEQRSNWKHKRLPTYRDAIDTIQSHGIRVNGCFILGLDGHTTDIFDDVRSAAESLELYDVQITLQTPFPGTPLYQRLLAENRMPDPTPWDRCTLFDLVFDPTPMTRAELTEGFRDLARSLYAEDATNQRRNAFKHKQRHRTRRRAQPTP